jgi:hypothetical protein
MKSLACEGEAEEISLAFFTLMRLKERKLFTGFNSFRDDPLAPALGHIDYCFDDRSILPPRHHRTWRLGSVNLSGVKIYDRLLVQ